MNSDTPRIRIPVPPSSADSGRTVALPFDGTNTSALNVGTGDDVFSLYAVRDKIGDGGMGVVYLARDRKLGRFVAIKRLHPKAQAIPLLRRRFLQEARAVAALNHVHIVHVYALGEDGDGPYIVMEYVPGPARETRGWPREPGQPNPPFSLDQRVSRQGQLAVIEAMQLLVKIGQAIAYAHENGVIHRDIKPSNVLLDPAGEPKIVDFGLARLMRDEESKLTVSGEKLLSLGYGAPEQETDAGSSDERSDVYGLGALLYFSITGQNPRYFRDSDIPPPLRDVLSKALATDREKRWPTARAFTEALTALLNHTQTEQQPTVKTTWRCKWCDTVNPLTLRYCGECGWDGGENCAECGQPTFFGVQFCGECGADARGYEAMHMVLSRMERCLQRREFEQVLSFAGRTLGFEPAGESGRALLKHMQALREKAESAIARREFLRERVGVELRTENFERAQAQIEEYRALRTDGRGFDQEAAQLPTRRIERDLSRARAALRNRNWETAMRLCDTVLSRDGPENREARALLRRVRYQRSRAQVFRWLLALLLFGLLYLSSLPPLLRLSPGMLRSQASLQRLFQPLIRLYGKDSPTDWPTRYAAWWGITDAPAVYAAMTTPTEPEPLPVDATPSSVQDIPLLIEAEHSAAIERDRLDYEASLAAIENDHLEALDLWAEQYVTALEALMEACRVVGDYDGWEGTHLERDRFALDQTLTKADVVVEPPELFDLQREQIQHLEALADARARSIIEETDRVLADLNSRLTQQTKAGDMAAATRINTEIRRIRGSALYAAAQDRLTPPETQTRARDD